MRKRVSFGDLVGKPMKEVARGSVSIEQAINEVKAKIQMQPRIVCSSCGYEQLADPWESENGPAGCSPCCGASMMIIKAVVREGKQ